MYALQKLDPDEVTIFYINKNIAIAIQRNEALIVVHHSLCSNGDSGLYARLRLETVGEMTNEAFGYPVLAVIGLCLTGGVVKK